MKFSFVEKKILCYLKEEHIKSQVEYPPLVQFQKLRSRYPAPFSANDFWLLGFHMQMIPKSTSVFLFSGCMRDETAYVT